MQLSSRFTMAVHLCACLAYFQESETVTSTFLAGSIGANPVIVRELVGQLKQAGIVSASKGKSGMRLVAAPEDVTLLDLYQATETVPEGGIFRFHAHPSVQCPVGRNIHLALDGRLSEAQRALERQLASTTLANVVADVQEAVAAGR